MRYRSKRSKPNSSNQDKDSGQKPPELVRQEFWALLLAHYAIRAVMTEAADTADLDADQLSFIRTLDVVCRRVINQAGFPSETLVRARTDTITEILERVTTGRRKRIYPRVAKEETATPSHQKTQPPRANARPRPRRPPAPHYSIKWRCSQYTSWTFGKSLRAAGILASMGTIGDFLLTG